MMKKKYDWVVVGGGFRSMIGAYALAKKGHSVCLIEAGKMLGGFLSPIPWEEFWVDKGPQFFDGFDQSDKLFIEDMIGPDILQDIGFLYSSYANGILTEDFAIPDWRIYGEDFSRNAFFDLLKSNSDNAEPNNFSELLEKDGGETISPKLKEFCKKFFLQNPSDLSVTVNNFVTFTGRKLLFDDQLSKQLKVSPLLDGILAAQKVTIGEQTFNLYPKGNNLNTVRVAMENALDRIGVEIMLNTEISGFETKGNTAILSNEDKIDFESILFGGHICDAEKTVYGTTNIYNELEIIPEIFHFFLVPKASVHNSYYIMDYDLDHKTTRVTNFCNYMDCIDDDGYGVICAEQTIAQNTEQWANPSIDQSLIFNEMKDCGLVDGPLKKSKSIKVPSTYKLPKLGYNAAVATFCDKTKQDFGDHFIIPNAFGLTRKNGLDSLKEINII